MERIYFRLNEEVPALENGALLLGNFDGVHQGHQTLIKAAKERFPFVSVLLFDANPADLLPSIGKSHQILTSLEDKLARFSSFGVDRAYIIHTDLSFLALSKQEFIESVLKPLNPSLIVVGTDYSFGRRAEGKAGDLTEQFAVLALPLLQDDGEKIATRNIILLLQKGEIEKANRELGYLYEIKGKVVHGLENGRNIGFPTANLALEFPYVLPKVGVYAGYTKVDGKTYRSIINVGNNPTVGRLDHPIVESHLLDFVGDLYGKEIAVSFLSWIREEKDFGSLENLKSQLEEDKRYFDKKGIK